MALTLSLSPAQVDAPQLPRRVRGPGHGRWSRAGGGRLGAPAEVPAGGEQRGGCGRTGAWE